VTPSTTLLSMKKMRILVLLALVAGSLSPTSAHAAGIPLSHCETITGNLPPANGSTNWTANGCNDVMYDIGGRTFFIQENQTPENPKDHSIILTNELFVQDSSKNWIDLGRGVRMIQAVSSYTHFTNFIETAQGLYLGGLYSEKDIGTCGQGVCKTIQEYATFKIDASNHVTKVLLPAIAGSNKVPGTPFASGNPSLLYFAQTQGLITTFGKKGIATTSGKIVKKGTAIIFYSLDLQTNKVTPLPQLTSIATEYGIPVVETFGSSVLLSNIESGKLMQLFPTGKLSNLPWDTNAIYEPIKDGLVATVANEDSLIFHLTNGEDRTCSYTGKSGTLPKDLKDVPIDPESLIGSASSNTATMFFHLGFTDQNNVIHVDSDCRTSINDFGTDLVATQKFVDEISNQVSGQAAKDEILRIFTPDGYLFDKALAISYQADAFSKTNGSGPRVVCTVDQSKVNQLVKNVFAGNHYVEWKVNPTAVGAECKYPGAQNFKIVSEALAISLHFVPESQVPSPTPTAKSTTIQAAGIGDAKWPAKCPAVTDTVGGAQPMISGFKFDGSGGENYMRLVDRGATAVTAPGNLLGCYADIPSLNGSQANAWHIGTINRDASGYYWLNAAGVRWGLTLSGTVLITDKSNPYYDKGHQFITY